MVDNESGYPDDPMDFLNQGVDLPMERGWTSTGGFWDSNTEDPCDPRHTGWTRRKDQQIYPQGIEATRFFQDPSRRTLSDQLLLSEARNIIAQLLKDQGKVPPNVDLEEGKGTE